MVARRAHARERKRHRPRGRANAVPLRGAGRTMKLTYVPARELARLRGLQASPAERCAAFADACRLNTLSMIMEAGSGHIGSSFSAMDLVAWLHLEELDARNGPSPRDVYFSSKGHDAPGLYSVLIGVGALDYALLRKLRRLGGLPGHPDI